MRFGGGKLIKFFMISLKTFQLFTLRKSINFLININFYVFIEFLNIMNFYQLINNKFAASFT